MHKSYIPGDVIVKKNKYKKKAPAENNLISPHLDCCSSEQLKMDLSGHTPGNLCVLLNLSMYIMKK